MKHQQVVVDYWAMAKTSCLFLLLALSGYVLIKMVQTIFWLPNYLQNNQKRLEELAAQYSVDLNQPIEKSEEAGETSEGNKENKPLDNQSGTEKTSAEAGTKETEVVDNETKKEL